MGERDDAIVFAREAATLDPSHPAAAGLAERMEAAGPRLKFRLNRPMTGGTRRFGKHPGPRKTSGAGMSFDINAIDPARNLRLAPERPAARAGATPMPASPACSRPPT